MEAVKQAQEQYISYYYNQAILTDDEKKNLLNDIQRFATIAIKEAPTELFTNRFMLNILMLAIEQKAKENSDLSPVISAFKGMETYCLLIMEQPWKTEFRVIKMYGGFFRTRIKSVIPECELIFEQAGYKIYPDTSTMVYQGPRDKICLLQLAFDCRLCQMECLTIAEHYSKIRNMSLTLIDAAVDILHHKHLQDQTVHTLRNGAVHTLKDKPIMSVDNLLKNKVKPIMSVDNLLKNNVKPIMSVDTLLKNTVLPPPLPKRIPIISSPDSKQYFVNRRLSEACLVNSDLSYNLLVPKLPARSIGHPRLSQSSSDSSVQALSQHPSSAKIFGSFAYIDDTTDEILPDLPQGTSEDHMKESLKFVSQKIFGKQPNSESRRITAEPPSLSIDEGIESFPYPSIKSESHIGKHSVDGQQLLPNKHILDFNEAFFDHRYHAANSSYSSAGLLQSSEKTIAQPMLNVTKPSAPNKTLLSRQSALPPPLPCRLNKPMMITEDNYLFGKATISPSRAQIPLETDANQVLFNHEPFLHKLGYFSGQLSDFKTYNRDHIINQQPAANSCSLKTTDSGHPMSTQITTSNSMDIVHWKCLHCFQLNPATTTVCPVCSNSALGREAPVSDAVTVKTWKLCYKCTYRNDPKISHCEMCETKLMC